MQCNTKIYFWLDEQIKCNKKSKIPKILDAPIVHIQLVY